MSDIKKYFKKNNEFQELVIAPAAFQLGQKIRMYRTLAKISQKQLGDLLNISSQQVHKYENGTNELSFKKICLIAEIFKITPEDLINGIDYRCPSDEKKLDTEKGFINSDNVKFLLEISKHLDNSSEDIKKKIIEFTKMMVA